MFETSLVCIAGSKTELPNREIYLKEEGEEERKGKRKGEGRGGRGGRREEEEGRRRRKRRGGGEGEEEERAGIVGNREEPRQHKETPLSTLQAQEQAHLADEAN